MAASSGLGKAIACEFAREKARVMLFSSSEEKLNKSRADIEAETGNKPEYFVGDITMGFALLDVSLYFWGMKISEATTGQ